MTEAHIMNSLLQNSGWNWRKQGVSLGFSGGSVVKNLPANVGDTADMGLIPGLGKSLGWGNGNSLQYSCLGGNGNSLQYSCLDNPMDRGAWRATVCGVIKSWTWLSDWTRAQGMEFFLPLAGMFTRNWDRTKLANIGPMVESLTQWFWKWGMPTLWGSAEKSLGVKGRKF